MSQQTVLNGRYELHRRLARGGMAEVFLARDQLLDRPVAVKVLFPEFATDPAFVARFRREAQAAANLNHPNIVGVYDWGEQAGTYYIVMEYVEGRSLAEILRTEGTLHPDRAADIAIDVAAALGFAHRNGVIHRDVKPGNILISARQVKVGDFGIARAMDAADENLTQTGAVMGTATYFSPEQAQGLPLDPRSDLYALGVVLYEMVTGRPPFSGDSPVSIAYKHVQEAPTPPRHINLDTPAPLEAIIMRLLSKDPAGRYPSAEDLRSDLRRFREGQSVLASAPAVDATAAIASTQAVRAYSDGTRMVPVEEMPREYQPPRRTGAFLVVLVILLLILAGLLVLLARVLGVGDKDETVAQVVVPSVIDLDKTAATAALEAEGFVVNPVTEPNDDKAVDIVFDQSPKGNERADEGATVTIRISAGANTVPMPNVVGQQETEAREFLVSQGFTTVETKLVDDDAPEGEVVDQLPVPDTPVAKNTLITITVSAGPAPVEVPNVVGMTVGEASNELGRVNLRLGSTSEEASTEPEGTVIRTDPAVGTPVEADTAVNLVVSSGPEEVTVPSVVGLSEEGARSALESRGFDVSVGSSTCTGDADEVCEVTSQNPGGGSSAAPGSTVTIVLGPE